MKYFQWDSNLGCQDNFFTKITKNMFKKIASCLFSSNLLQSNSMQFYPEFQRGSYGIGGIKVLFGSHLDFKPWKLLFLLSKIDPFEKIPLDLQLSNANFIMKNVKISKNNLQTFHNTFQSIQN